MELQRADRSSRSRQISYAEAESSDGEEYPTGEEESVKDETEEDMADEVAASDEEAEDPSDEESGEISRSEYAKLPAGR